MNAAEAAPDGASSNHRCGCCDRSVEVLQTVANNASNCQRRCCKLLAVKLQTVSGCAAICYRAKHVDSMNAAEAAPDDASPNHRCGCCDRSVEVLQTVGSNASNCQRKVLQTLRFEATNCQWLCCNLTTTLLQTLIGDATHSHW
jgi:hypothetical protein